MKLANWLLKQISLRNETTAIIVFFGTNVIQHLLNDAPICSLQSAAAEHMSNNERSSHSFHFYIHKQFNYFATFLKILLKILIHSVLLSKSDGLISKTTRRNKWNFREI